eukprot:3846108-Lingulodinium_polyedra.AAC.1
MSHRVASGPPMPWAPSREIQLTSLDLRKPAARLLVPRRTSGWRHPGEVEFHRELVCRVQVRQRGVHDSPPTDLAGLKPAAGSNTISEAMHHKKG